MARSVAGMLVGLGCVVVPLLAPVAVAAPSENRFVLVSVADQAGQPLLGLQADDFKVENGGAPCDVIGITPASYPLAIVLDTSSYARSDFRMLQQTLKRLVDGLSPREIAVYTSGATPSRIQDFTKDQGRVARAIASSVATSDGATHTLETILRASTELARLKAPVTGIVVASAGGIEMNPPAGQQVSTALAASATILNVVEERTLHLDRGTPRQDPSNVLQALTGRTRGQYLRGPGAAVYASGLAAVRRQLDAESILEYVVSSGAPHSLSLRVKPPSIVVMAVDLER